MFNKGGYIVKKVTTNPTYGKNIVASIYYEMHGDLLYNVAPLIEHNYYTLGYVDELLEKTISCFQEGSVADPPDVPEPLCSRYDRSEKDAAIKEHRSRFLIS